MRQVYIVNATQVVTSEAHPEGVYSVVSGYPKTYDTQNYSDELHALNAARAEYYSRLASFYTGAATRVMGTVTLEQADGRMIQRESIGAFPETEVVVNE